MDGPLLPCLAGVTWSGLVKGHTLAQGSMPASSLALAHGQRFHHFLDLPVDEIMIYQTKVSWDDAPVLTADLFTQTVLIPSNAKIGFQVIKEACSGIGCMGFAASYMGFKVAASMDWNPKVVACLQHNAQGVGLQGDINQEHDRHRLHVAGGPLRCTLMSGFPCQPLSTQGDAKGADDSRLLPFRSTLKIAWEQQMGALILECVPKALEAQYIQEELQQLAWSMGMSLQQRILHLSRCWPCSRTCWWCIITYMRSQVDAFPDMPATEPSLVVGDSAHIAKV